MCSNFYDMCRFYDDWFHSLYNVIFMVLPVIILGLFEKENEKSCTSNAGASSEATTDCKTSSCEEGHLSFFDSKRLELLLVNKTFRIKSLLELALLLEPQSLVSL